MKAAPLRLAGRFLLLLLAGYGPLAPLMLLFLLAMPPLIALSGWPWWVDLVVASLECGLIVGAALWLGPSALREARAFLDDGASLRPPAKRLRNGRDPEHEEHQP